MLANFIRSFLLHPAELLQSHQSDGSCNKRTPDNHCFQNISMLDLQVQKSSRSTGTYMPDSSEITFSFQALLQNVSMILPCYPGRNLHVCSAETLPSEAQEICTFTPCLAESLRCVGERTRHNVHFGFLEPQMGH